MSTQEIADYLTKQLFIEKNVVTFRSLSRQFSLHVNVAKNELATFHHNAPYQSQPCQATFLLSGIPRAPVYDEDYDMEGVSQEPEDDDGEEVPQTQISLVSEKELEDAKASFEELTSVHVYSLSAAPIHDAGLVCGPTEFVRKVDCEKGPAYAVGLGRLVGKGIKMGISKKKPKPAAPVAGPSKIKESDPKAASTKAEPAKETATTVADKGKEKPKATGKLNFFSKAKEPAAKPVKAEETVDSKKKMFFSKPAVPAKTAPVEPPAPKAKESTKAAPKEEETAKVAPKGKIEKPESSRGLKRKSSVGLDAREESPANVATTSKVPAPPPVPEPHRTKRRVVLSDDEESDSVVVAKPTRRKTRPSLTTDSADNSAAERDVRSLMDIDDDEVEKVSRVPSTNASGNELDDQDDQDASTGIQDEDVSMDDAPVKAKPKARKPKAVIPVGKNGLPKRKISKTRKVKDANGYLVREDYSDWESVEEGAESEAPAEKPAAKAKPKAKPKPVKQEREDSFEVEEPVKPKGKATKVKEEDVFEVEDAPTKKKAPAPAKKAAAKPAPKPKAPAKGASNVKGKGQQTLNFFGAKKT